MDAGNSGAQAERRETASRPRKRMVAAIGKIVQPPAQLLVAKAMISTPRMDRPVTLSSVVRRRRVAKGSSE
ncbi:hypothetical protein, partial [Proteus vulgaris]|uniref:hypothetical protein n=1 Tax=Proteus vulgaris TaxID=585 RepID=UPI001952E2CD